MNTKTKINELKKTGMVMNIFIILRLVQCTCFALYVLWNKWSKVMVELVFYFTTSWLWETIRICLCLCTFFPLGKQLRQKMTCGYEIIYFETNLSITLNNVMYKTFKNLLNFSNSKSRTLDKHRYDYLVQFSLDWQQLKLSYIISKPLNKWSDYKCIFWWCLLRW